MTANEDNPEYAGFNTKHVRESGVSFKPKNKTMYTPLIDMKPSDPSTVMTAMIEARKLMNLAGQSNTIITADQQIYRVMIDISWAYEGDFKDFIFRLGGMHLLISFVGAVGNLMGNSGLEELMKSAFAGISKMLTGKNFPMNVRAFRMVVGEVLRHRIVTFMSYDEVIEELVTFMSYDEVIEELVTFMSYDEVIEELVTFMSYDEVIEELVTFMSYDEVIEELVTFMSYDEVIEELVTFMSYDEVIEELVTFMSYDEVIEELVTFMSYDEVIEELVTFMSYDEVIEELVTFMSYDEVIEELVTFMSYDEVIEELVTFMSYDEVIEELVTFMSYDEVIEELVTFMSYDEVIEELVTFMSYDEVIEELVTFMSYDEVIEELEEISKSSRTAKHWVSNLIKPVLLMMKYVRAEREGEWALHLFAVREMIPFFFLHQDTYIMQDTVHITSDLWKICQIKFCQDS